MPGVEAVEGVEGNLNRCGGGAECKWSTKASSSDVPIPPLQGSVESPTHSGVYGYVERPGELVISCTIIAMAAN